MAERRITRKELLKEPDEFLTTSGMVVQYVRTNPKPFIAGCVVFVIALVAVIGFLTMRKHQEARSLLVFEQAMREYHNVLGSGEQVAPEEFDTVLKQFQTVAADYGSFPAGEMALLYTGHVLYRKGDFKGALEQYQRAQATGLVKSGLGPLILYHIASTRLALKEYEAAAGLFQQLSEDTNSPYRREASITIARIYEMTGKSKEAAQAYKQYLKMFPEAPDAPFVRARLADLAAKG
ncbi:MAG: tetratricopeptide repeat protein [Desulfomonile tiedjei]|nr:tetratricopeptide repeat protein [Desulfomonile tiedjei]